MMPEESNAPPPLPRRNWLWCNWKWLLPSGCLFLVLMALAFAAGIFFFVVGVMKESGAYKTALTRARENPAVIEALGTPISEDWLPSGSAHSVGPGGDANLAIPIRGPKGKATIYVAAMEVVGIWQFNTLVVEIEATHQRIDLTATANARARETK
jgi:Cytochrome oxidase complex assembly protein 1